MRLSAVFTNQKSYGAVRLGFHKSESYGAVRRGSPMNVFFLRCSSTPRVKNVPCDTAFSLPCTVYYLNHPYETVVSFRTVLTLSLGRGSNETAVSCFSTLFL